MILKKNRNSYTLSVFEFARYYFSRSSNERINVPRELILLIFNKNYLEKHAILLEKHTILMNFCFNIHK